jgi:hypothetical protein
LGGEVEKAVNLEKQAVKKVFAVFARGSLNAVIASSRIIGITSAKQSRL